MCAPRRRPWAALPVLLAGGVLLGACSTPERSGESFCRQVGRELPAIGQPIATGGDVKEMVKRYERLLERAPLAIEADVAALTDLFRMAASVNPKDEDSVQALANAAYAANRPAARVREWVKDTCAVDIATGLTIAPPRTAPETTVPESTSTSIATTSTTAGG